VAAEQLRALPHPEQPQASGGGRGGLEARAVVLHQQASPIVVNTLVYWFSVNVTARGAGETNRDRVWPCPEGSSNPTVSETRRRANSLDAG